MAMTEQFADSCVAITGASRGIGASAAWAFAKAGYKVALLARGANDLQSLADEIGPAAQAFPCDVADFDQVQRAMDQAADQLGPIDVLINNAGVIAPMGPMAILDPDQWGQLIDINVKGVFHGTRAVLPAMVKRGGGTVLTVSSGAAHRPVDGWSAYCASKAAVAMFTDSLHLEYSHKGIRAMGLSPGTVATQMQRDIKGSGVGPVAELDWSDHIPPEWAAQALLWMAGTGADAHLGQEISLRDETIRQTLGLT